MLVCHLSLYIVLSYAQVGPACFWLSSWLSTGVCLYLCNPICMSPGGCGYRIFAVDWLCCYCSCSAVDKPSERTASCSDTLNMASHCNYHAASACHSPHSSPFGKVLHNLGLKVLSLLAGVLQQKPASRLGFVKSVVLLAGRLLVAALFFWFGLTQVWPHHITLFAHTLLFMSLHSAVICRLQH